MFTWNIQYISKARLAQTLNQLMLNSQKGDVLVRIHTAIHSKEESVELAKFIKQIVPNAVVLGTSTSAIIGWGKLMRDQCVVSVTLMNGAKIKGVNLPAFDEKGNIIPHDELCNNLKKELGDFDPRLMLTFLTAKYREMYGFVSKCNEYFKGAQMIGGLADAPSNDVRKSVGGGFLFNENGYTENGLMVVAINGKGFECMTNVATGLQTIGDEIEVNKTFGSIILETDHKDAAEEYRLNIGDEIKDDTKLSYLFPLAFSNETDIPVFVEYRNNLSIEDIYPKDNPEYKKYYDKYPSLDTKSKREVLLAGHDLCEGSRVKRAFIYDKKIISDNRALFRYIENFDKPETIFAYSCTIRSKIYSNCLKWELSAYEKTNICGCVTIGEIACVNGVNVFANCSLAISVFGEKQYSQQYNPYTFKNIDSLEMDNQELLNYLMKSPNVLEEKNDSENLPGIKDFVRECELKLFYSETEGIPNEPAMKMDIEYRALDRICMIDITDRNGMRAVFPEQLVNLTYKNYITQCRRFAKEKHYMMYLLEDWNIAIGTHSYRTSLKQFREDMKILQRNLFESSREHIAIVPLFCLLDGCKADNLESTYYSARVEMMKKNIQFHIACSDEEVIDVDSIRAKYQMVNVVNYAISHDKVVPFYQGIYDNKLKKITHYEALMRLEDENGRIYYPSEFLDVARSFGHLYDSLSAIMIKKVFEKFKNTKKTSVSINLGIRDIRNAELVEYIYDFLACAKYPENFVFELLENEDIEDYDILITFVDRIHTLGGLISIDDFGTGYSNLQHLMSIHSDFIKIDGSIIRKCCESSESENLIALISGWRNISSRNVSIVAEYVENSMIQDKMTKFEIDYSQGYLFSEPSPDI